MQFQFHNSDPAGRSVEFSENWSRPGQQVFGDFEEARDYMDGFFSGHGWFDNNNPFSEDTVFLEERWGVVMSIPTDDDSVLDLIADAMGELTQEQHEIFLQETHYQPGRPRPLVAVTVILHEEGRSINFYYESGGNEPDRQITFGLRDDGQGQIHMVNLNQRIDMSPDLQEAVRRGIRKLVDNDSLIDGFSGQD